MLLLAMVLVAATLATMSAATAFADDSDSQLRHKINVIQSHPGPVTAQERHHIQNLRDRIHDNDNDDDDDDDDN